MGILSQKRWREVQQGSDKESTFEIPNRVKSGILHGYEVVPRVKSAKHMDTKLVIGKEKLMSSRNLLTSSVFLALRYPDLFPNMHTMTTHRRDPTLHCPKKPKE